MINTIKKSLLQFKYVLLITVLLFILSIGSSFYYYLQFSPEKAQKQLSAYIIEQETKANILLADTNLLLALNTDTAIITKKDMATDGFGLFVFDGSDSTDLVLNYWSNNIFYFTNDVLSKEDGSHFATYQNGEFEVIKKKITTSSKTVLAIIMLPIRWHYFVNNKYLKTNFAYNNYFDKKFDIVKTKTALPITNINGKPLFYLQEKQNAHSLGYSWVTIILRCLSILFFLYLLHCVAVNIAKEINFRVGFIFLLGSIFFLRFITYGIPFPFKFSDLLLFDPSIYASNFLHPSLGDLLINALIVFWLVWFYKFNYVKTSYKKIGYLANNLWIAYIIALTNIAFVFSSVIRSLIVDSKISFDVINFFSLNFFSLVGFVILSIAFLCFFHLSHMFIRPVLASNISLKKQLITLTIVGALAYIISIFFNAKFNTLIAVLWLAIYLAIINYRKKDIDTTLVKSSFFIIWIMLFALSIATFATHQSKLVEVEQRKKFAEKLSLQDDPNSETLLSIAITNFTDNFLLSNFSRLQNEFSNKYIKDSLVSQNFSGYLNKYDTRIYTYDSSLKALYNDDSTSYTSINNLIKTKAKETGIESLYSYESVDNKVSYMYKKQVAINNKTLGYLIVSTKPKFYKSEALYPELFKQVQDLSVDFNTNYTYSIYSNGKLLSKHNNHNFSTNLTKKLSSTTEVFVVQNNDGYSELLYNAPNNKQVLIAKKNNYWLQIFTLFAYLFCVFLAAITFFHLLIFLLRYNKKISINQLFNFNIRTQIHSTIIFISIFSFIIIGVATISFFIFRFNQNNQERLSKSIQIISNQIEEQTKTIRSQLAFDDVITPTNNIGLGTDIEKKINNIAEVHNVEINLYDIEGTLITTTQPYIFNKHLLSNKINAKAYYELYYNSTAQYVQQEKVGSFIYLSIYTPLKDEEGNTYAYLNIPYLNSQAELNQEISSFLVTLINLNAFIFLLAGVLALWLTNKIASSFKLIGNKMKEINLGKQNEVIEWHKTDEIGVLVNEYNKMVLKLEQSAKVLAKSEREDAWKEMAKQVAHEIKNPLTPMKLSIQYLQKSIDSNSDNVKELSTKVANTLVQQIDQLANIAADFSQFANISNTKIEPVNLNQEINNQIQLYQSYNNLHIQYTFNNYNTIIFADKIQLNRLFTNLIKNAIEAADTDKPIVIKIDQQCLLNYVQISIQDNGNGIPVDMQHKIFTPNFTTKSSGTGLGLAICKGIVENINGNIWFSTKENIGTTFFVKLPLVNVGQ